MKTGNQDFIGKMEETIMNKKYYEFNNELELNRHLKY